MLSNTIVSSQSSNTAPIRTIGNPMSLVNSSVQRRQQVSAVRSLQRTMMNDTSRQLLAQIATSTTTIASHVRGIRRLGCPCCDPDNASTIVDQFLSQT
jgi:chaperone required for assembly of F1-ATPase